MSQDVELGELLKTHHGEWKASVVLKHLVVRGTGSVGIDLT